jgi:hypothetical protein
VVVQGTTTRPGGWPVQKSGSPAVFPTYTWDAGATLHHGDELVQVQACYGSSATDPSPVCSMASTVQLATHAFGDSYATEAVGPGSLSLLTGDYQVSAADVSVPTYQGSLSIGRSLTTLAPVNPAPTDSHRHLRARLDRRPARPGRRCSRPEPGRLPGRWLPQLHRQ